MDWTSITQGLVSVIITLIVGLLVLNQIAPNIISEAFKSAWQAERDNDAAERADEREHLKSELQQILERYKVGFSTLHSARANNVAELYAKLLEAWRAWDDAVRPIGPDVPFSDGHFSAAISCSLDFRSLSYQSRLYVTTAGLSLIFRAQSMFDSMRTAVKTSYLDPGQAFDSIVAAYDAMDEEFNDIQGQLEAEFRAILGAEDKIEPRS
jgi:hypothetical protein